MLGDIEARIVSFIQHRLETRGAIEGGLFNYYERLAQTGRGFVVYEKPIADFIKREAAHYRCYIEVGAGLGQLTALLVSEGFNCIGVESDSRRYAAMNDLFQDLELDAKGILGWFPEAAKNELGPDTLVIFTNVVTGAPNAEHRMLEAATQCDGIIMDLRLFGRIRNTPLEQDELASLVAARGYRSPMPVFSGPGNRLVYFGRA